MFHFYVIWFLKRRKISTYRKLYHLFRKNKLRKKHNCHETLRSLTIKKTHIYWTIQIGCQESAHAQPKALSFGTMLVSKEKILCQPMTLLSSSSNYEHIKRQLHFMYLKTKDLRIQILLYKNVQKRIKVRIDQWLLQLVIHRLTRVHMLSVLKVITRAVGTPRVASLCICC